MRDIYYILLCALYSSLLIFTNLIYQKFFPISFWGINLELSVGIITYSLTLLITNIITEIYDEQKSYICIKIGVFSSLFIAGLIIILNILPNTPWSPLDIAMYEIIFMRYNGAIVGSLIACYISQSIDVWVYNKLKKSSFHLLIRNNFSAIISLFIDTVIMAIFLYIIQVLPRDKVLIIIFSEYPFKIIFYFVITPVFYVLIKYIKKLNSPLRIDQKYPI